MFRAVFLQKSDSTVFSEVRELSEDSLPEGDVLVAVDYSTIKVRGRAVIDVNR